MSNYRPDGEWDKVWDALYWTFIDKKRKILKKNGRIAIQIKYYDRKTKAEKKEFEEIKKKILKRITK
jgi:deoxyribodipyrimidine photolyase-related protein